MIGPGAMVHLADRRPWFRLHRSTWLFCLLCASGMSLVNIRGRPVEWRQIRPRHDDNAKAACAHGWPCVYLENHVKDWLLWASEKPPISRWDLTSNVHRRSLCALAVDIFAALGIVAAVGAAFEWRRRRRHRLLQFSVAEIMLLTLLCAAGLGWHVRERARDARRQAALNALGAAEELRWFTLDASATDRIGALAVGPAQLSALQELLRVDSQPVLIVPRPLSDAGRTQLKQLTDLQHVEFLYPDDLMIACLTQMPNLRSLRFDRDIIWFFALGEPTRRPASAGTALIGGLRKLQRLEIVATDLGDAGMAPLAQLGELETLDLSLSNRIAQTRAGDPLEKFENYYSENGADESVEPQSRVTDAGLSHLKALYRLRILRLPGTHLSDAGLEHLADLRRLEELDLRHTNISGKGLVHLRRLDSLKGLDLSGSKIDDAGMQQFPKLCRLEALSLAGTNVTEDVLPRLNGLKSLSRLYLGATNVRSLAALDLESLPSLEYLDVCGAKVAKHEIDLLRRRWPRLAIVDRYVKFKK